MATSNTPGAASTASDHEEEEEQVSELEEDPMLPLYALMAADEDEEGDGDFYAQYDEDEEDDDENDEDGYDSHTAAQQVDIARMARQRAMAAIHALRTGRLSDILLGVEGVSYISPQPEEVPMTGPRYPVPNETGEKLMRGSDFGSAPSTVAGRKSRQEYLLKRELGDYQSPGQIRTCLQGAVQSYLPESEADFIVEHEYHCYIGQFSTDGNFFYSCAQDMRVRMYDTSDPYGWKYYKTVDYVGGSWTLTDASLSPDNKFLAYSSITSAVYLADTTPGRDDTLRLEFAMGPGPHSMHPRSGIMSVRFSGDGNELVAGAKDNCVYIYDITAGRPVLRLRGHTNEVNAVCYGDESSPHIIYSGSDDCTVKIWDRRSISDKRPVGVFTGHTEGITSIASKGDGRYVLSNGKDQQMKLWDLRNMMDPSEFSRLPRTNLSTGFDYRTDRYPMTNPPRRHPHDKSLVTYEGHSVQRTLIRCYFSPPVSTGSRYVYSGSANGKVKIWNIDATLAREVNVHKATKVMRPNAPSYHNDPYRIWWGGYERDNTCVRDVSWHPSAPVFAATSFQGGGIGKGSVSVHTWRGADADWDEEERESKRGYKPRVYSTEMRAI